MPDGSRPPLHSGGLYEGPDGVPVEEGKPQAELDRERLHYEIDLRRLQQLDLCCEFAERMIGVGMRALDEPQSPGPAPEESPGMITAQPPNTPGAGRGGRPPFSTDKDPYIGNRGGRRDGVTVPASPHDDPETKGVFDACDSAERFVESIRGKAGGTSRRPLPVPEELTFSQAVAIGERGVKLLLAASDKRAEVAHRLVDRALVLDTRHSFLQNRAVAVVYATLLHLDDSFRELGFGAWMPFRFPDQWLAFCGVLRRVLAANGLIHSEHAETYRKLLDETPPPEGETQTPANDALCHTNRGAGTMAELARRLQSEARAQPP